MHRGAIDEWTLATTRCPKHMEHGPCGGVTAAGDCEVPEIGSCAFLDVAAPYPPGGHATATWRARDRPLIVADLPAAALSAASLRECADVLRDRVDACLLGDNAMARVQFPPSYRVRLLADAGLRAWAGISCRDRNRAALAGEVAACLDAGALGLHCVTGDHTALGSPRGTDPVFDLDSLGLVALVAELRGEGSGVACSVAHAPAAPPHDVRLPRLLAKLAAGADTVFVDHCGGVAAVADAVAALRAARPDVTVLVCVPVVVDVDSALVLDSFAGDRVPPGYVERIVTAGDARSAGIGAAADLGEQMLAIDGVDGVNLSGGAAPDTEVAFAHALADIALQIGATAPAIAR